MKYRPLIYGESIHPGDEWLTADGWQPILVRYNCVTYIPLRMPAVRRKEQS